ncbi:uncharacterized protein LOC143281004 isoform X1 [Babylonia areolata]|uniref:uncharacterized protein LOC143281004 isoform X1 n=1 Tax=Babylonia areolata TaxID=304850 RepID=UPI003FD0AA63
MNQPPGSRNRDGSLPFYRKVLLAAAMTGNEICVSFQQLYQVPLLQIQGVPVTYVSLYPIVAGPVALLLLNLSGCLSDRGSNHQKRKAIVVALIAAITMLGIVVVVVANSKLLSADQCTGSTNETTCFDESDSPGRRDADNQSHFTFTNESFLTSDDFPAMVTAVTDHSAARRDSSLDDEDALSVPVTALLGLSGFALMDIGYDVNQASIRTSVLASSSQSDHSVLLLLSLALAAFGGCITNTLGLLDLSQLFGWGAEDGSVVAQTTVQLLVCGLVLLVTVTSTVTTALLGTPTLRPPAFTPLHEDGTESEQIACYGTFGSDERSPQNDDDRHDRNLCSEETSFGRREERTVDELDTFEESVLSATKPLVSEKERSLQLSYSSTFEHLNILHHSTVYQRSSSPQLSSEVAQQKSEFLASEQSRWNKHKVNFITACVAAYLGMSMLYAYNMYVTDFMGKAVMGGDPNAPHDSAEYKQYEEGLRLAGAGLFAFYCSYFLVNCVHGKLLAFWGMKVDFCLSHGLMAAAVLCLALTKQLAAFYVCCVLYSFQRSAFFSVPYIIANDYAQKQEHCGHGQSETGRLMAILGSMVPLNYCTVFMVSGPLITLTNYDGAPLIVSSACAGLATLLFMVIYRP